MDWAEEMANGIVCEWESSGDSVRFHYEYVKDIADMLRIVQRETVEDIRDMLDHIQGEQSLSEWQYPIVCCKNAIEQRFGLKEKHETPADKV